MESQHWSDLPDSKEQRLTMASTRSEAKMELIEKAVMGLHENMSQMHGRLEKIDHVVEGLMDLKRLMELLIKGQGGAGDGNQGNNEPAGAGGGTQGRTEGAVSTGGGGREEISEEVRMAMRKI